jgi:hypothetical protein
MYSFAQRSDTTVLDEPLYASYLRLTGLARPYREQVGGAGVAVGSREACCILRVLPAAALRWLPPVSRSQKTRPHTLQATPTANRRQVLAAQEIDGNKVVRDQILGPRSKQVGTWGP